MLAAAVVDEISPLEIRLFVPDDRVVNEDVGGGEGAFGDGRFCVLIACGFCFNSPSGRLSSFSLVEQLENYFQKRIIFILIFEQEYYRN